MKTNSEPRSLPSKINRDVGVAIPLGFSRHPLVMAGRDELTPLLLSCPADLARQEMLCHRCPCQSWVRGREMAPGVGFPWCRLAV